MSVLRPGERWGRSKEGYGQLPSLAEGEVSIIADSQYSVNIRGAQLSDDDNELGKLELCPQNGKEGVNKAENPVFPSRLVVRSTHSGSAGH